MSAEVTALTSAIRELGRNRLDPHGLQHVQTYSGPLYQSMQYLADKAMGEEADPHTGSFSPADAIAKDQQSCREGHWVEVALPSFQKDAEVTIGKAVLTPLVEPSYRKDENATTCAAISTMVVLKTFTGGKEPELGPEEFLTMVRRTRPAWSLPETGEFLSTIRTEAIRQCYELETYPVIRHIGATWSSLSTIMTKHLAKEGYSAGRFAIMSMGSRPGRSRWHTVVLQGVTPSSVLYYDSNEGGVVERNRGEFERNWARAATETHILLQRL